MPGLSQFRLLTLHYALYQLSAALAGGFVGAYLLRLGFSLPCALLAYAGLLGARFGLRFLALGVTRRLGYRATVATGAALASLQFLPLMRVENPAWLAAWLLIVAVAEALYWPVFHAATAVIGASGARGRDLGLRIALGSLIGVAGPLAGGCLLERVGPYAAFNLGATLAFLSVFPLLRLREIPAGPVPSLRETVRFTDRVGILAFAADGWMSSGLGIAWPMALFLLLGSRYDAFGAANAIAGLLGAVVGIVCGRGIDRGQRDRWLVVVSLALALGFALRAGANWSPMAAAVANATGAMVMGLYVPVLMSAIYERAETSGAAYRFHLAAEAGWDVGAVSGCVVAAVVTWLVPAPSVAVLPGALGIGVIYACIRSFAPKPSGTDLALAGEAVLA